MSTSNPFLTNSPYLEVTFLRGEEVILKAYVKTKSNFRIDFSKENHLIDLFKKIKNRKHYASPTRYTVSGDNVEENIQHFLDNHASSFNFKVEMIHHNKHFLEVKNLGVYARGEFVNSHDSDFPTYSIETEKYLSPVYGATTEKEVEEYLENNLDEVLGSETPTVFFMIGVQGSGKSTFRKKYLNYLDVISFDEDIMARFSPIEKNYSKAFRHYENLESEDQLRMLNDKLDRYMNLLKSGKSVVIDQVNLSTKAISKYFVHAPYEYTMVAIVLETGNDTLRGINEKRGFKKIPVDVLERSMELTKDKVYENFSFNKVIKIKR